MTSSSPTGSVSAPGRSPARRRRGALVLATVALVGALVTLAGFVAVRRAERREADLAFAHEAELRLDAFAHEVDAHLRALSGLVTTMDAAPLADQTRFEELARRLLAIYPAYRALEWVPRVPADRRASWEAGMRRADAPRAGIRELGPDGGWVPAGERPDYWPVMLASPLAGNEEAVGFDLASQPARRAAIERALATGEPTLTSAVRPVQAPAAGTALLALLPLFESADAPPCREGAVGLAVGVLSAQALLDAALHGCEGMDVRVVDTEPPPGGDAEVVLAAGGPTPAGAAAGARWHEEVLPIGGRSWCVRCAEAGAPPGAGWPAWLVLGTGLFLTGGLVTHLRQRARNETALEESEQRFRILVEHAPEAIVLLDVDQRRFVDANENAVRLFKLERERLLRAGPVELSPRMQPGGRPSDELAEEMVQRALRGEAPVFEWLHRDAEGREVPCEVRLVRLRSGDRRLVRGSVTDITDRKRAQERQALMMRELDHRVKNNLATVQALADHTRATTTSAEEFHEAFTGRIRALARTHEALAGARWDGVELTELVRTALGAFDTADRVRLTGEALLLPEHASLPMGMTLHELATNAAKHGALSAEAGRIEVAWRRLDDGELELSWAERGGPPVAPPERRGLGTALVRGLVEYELRGRVEIEYPPEGLRCRVRIPIGADLASLRDGR